MGQLGWVSQGIRHGTPEGRREWGDAADYGLALIALQIQGSRTGAGASPSVCLCAVWLWAAEDIPLSL